MIINLHIEKLILDAPVLGNVRREQLAGAVEAHLARLLAGGGLRSDLPSLAERPTIRGGSITYGKPEPSGKAGRQIAEAVYHGIGAAEPGGPGAMNASTGPHRGRQS